MKMEVRCCCDASKLFGWIDVCDQSKDELRSHYLFHILPEFGSFLGEDAKGEIGPKLVELKVDGYQPKQGKVYLALKADGVSIETLRKFGGFKENKN